MNGLYVPPPRADGTIEYRRFQQPWPAGKPFRILSIDGGGIRGILPASVLAELERRYLGGESIARHFDLIAGTSTGGIIALGLGMGFTAAQIRDLYLDRGHLIFPTGRLRRASIWCRHWVAYAYDRAALESELRRLFTDRVLGESSSRLCIPAFDGLHGEPWIYKTPHHPDYKKDQRERVVDVGLATSAAPTFFRPHRVNGYPMLDGGIWANNPIMNAVVDALACFDLDRGSIRVLSLGSGGSSFTMKRGLGVAGKLLWAKPVLEAAFRAQSHNALGQTFLLLGKPNVLRIDAPASAKAVELDDFRRAANELPPTARALVEASGVQIRAMFLGSAGERQRPGRIATTA